MNALNEHDLIYLAAIVDLRSCINIRRQFQKTAVVYSAEMIISAQPKIVTFLHERTGLGNIYSSKNATTFVWRMGREDAVNLLRAVFPFLKFAQYEASILFEFNDTIGPCNKGLPIEIVETRERLHKQLTALHKNTGKLSGGKQ
jgi:hypothetical protein